MNAVLKEELAPDLDEARRFLGTLDPKAESFTFQTFDDDKNRKDPRFTRVLHGSLEEHRRELARLNRGGAGVFVTVNATDGRGRTNENIVRVRAVFQEDDTLGTAPPLPVEPHIVVETSPGKFHRYILTDTTQIGEFKSVQECVVMNYASDPNAKDLARVLRLPGFFHRKGNAYMVRIVALSKHPRLLWEEVKAVLPPVSLPKGVLKRDITGLKQGERNDGLFRYASKLRADGVPENEARQLVLEAAARCDPPLDEAEALACLKSAWRYEANFHCTDLGNAKRLVARHGADIRYCPDFKKWLGWDERRWYFDDDGMAMRRAKATVTGIYAEAAQEKDDARRAALAKHGVASESAGRIAAMVDLAKSEAELVARSHEFDLDPMLLGTANGTVNLRTGGLREPRRDDYITKQVMTHYDPAARCPVWHEFLNRIMAGDTEMIGFLQRSIGYSLTGSTAEQCLFMLYGTGANGKSTFLNVLGELMGDYGANTPAESLMVQQNSGVRNDIARLRGVRFVTAIETEDGQRLAESLVKSLVGGDTISARFLYGEFFDFKPQFKLFFAANHKPIIKGDDYAIWRRVRLVPFEVTVPEAEQDRALPEKLRAELPGILAWAVEGCLEWQRIGLRPPAKVLAATAEYRGEMDFLQQFFDECCHIAPAAAVGATELYAAYKVWAEDNTGWFLTQTKFGRKLAERGFAKERTPRIRYRGIGLVKGDF